MAENTNIEWCDHTLNLWEGCTKVSPACDNCYAETRAKRFGQVKWGKHPRRRMSEATRKRLFKWERAAAVWFECTGHAQTVFVNSLSDFFDNKVPPEWREEAWEDFRQCKHLIIILLTKRPQNIAKMKPPFWDEIKHRVWLGTTVENQTEAERRIPHLIHHDSAVRFLSCEPLLGHVDLTDLCTGHYFMNALEGTRWLDNPDGGPTYSSIPPSDNPTLGQRAARINWVIVGAESGSGARPMPCDWACSIRRQCEMAGVLFFMKQLSGPNGKALKDIDGFPSDLRVREYPNAI